MPNLPQPYQPVSLAQLNEGIILNQHPQLFCPFPEASNPAETWVQQSTADWAARFHLVQSDRARRRFERLQYGTLMSRAYPMATPAALALIADWNTWLFLLDDQCDEQGLGRDPHALMQLHTNLLTILQGATPPSAADAQWHALHNIVTRLRAEQDAAWMRRFVQCVADYCAANVWEARNRAAHQVPSEYAYRQMRPLTGAVFCYLTLIELAHQMTLPRTILDHPDVQRLTLMTNNVICWANDIISLAKELEAGDVHNLVYIVHREHGLSLAEAIQYVARLHDAEVHAFIQTNTRLSVEKDDDRILLQRYVTGMQAWMRANLDWSAATARYHPMAAV